ncbi:MAG: ChaN family lipoprotein [Candidatus Cloacimonetes bacterium]|jgi:uncharacterized iron-regulated protein|nr:ChaN family lipoprotein [Candidatus Cloacimonadota bacterium]MDD2423142.1 ChaN family lipoprotein [Candidatus Cloacimonadota bacterium]MDD3562981.1 ChaN family lipoprotein [Candidatus Cloacimonadota bacterium]MDY0325557.1 ChaN family lipoprotein [Candidatus Cloacimonadaceae bacterium]
MKKILNLSLLLLMGTMLFAFDVTILSSETGARLELQELAKDLRNYDVIFFGEWHGEKSLHQLQRELLAELPLADRQLILSFEMWERHAQEDLDLFLADKIPEEEFVKLSEAWPNYEDYQPLIHFAKKHKLTVVAANVPRPYASRTAKEGWDFTEELPPGERVLIAAKLTAPDDEYREAFFQTMGDMTGHPMKAESLERMYQAQCMKDDTMAESIALALKKNPKARVLHFNGDFHSHKFLGTVSRLQSAMPELKIAVLSPLVTENIEEFKLDKEEASAGTHIILMRSPEQEEGK